MSTEEPPMESASPVLDEVIEGDSVEKSEPSQIDLPVQDDNSRDVTNKDEEDAEGGEMDDLFGDDDDEEDDDDEGIVRRKRDTNFDDDDENEDETDINSRRRAYMDDDEEEEQAMYTRKFYGEDDENKYDQEESMHEFKEANVELVRHIVPYLIRESDEKNVDAKNSNSNVTYYAKIPPFLTLDPIPFDPPSFEQQVKERLENTSSNEDRIGDRLIDENTIRWRYSRDSNQTVFKESNAQIVQWSDGSYSLKLGDEYTDILVNDVGNTFLTISHDQQELMQCVDGGEITKSAMFVPISTNSKLHQRLTKAIVRRNETSAEGPRSMIINVDPEVEKRELEKRQSQMFRDRRKRKQKEIEAEQESLDSPGFSQGSYGASRKRSQTPSYGDRSRNQDEYEEDDFIVDEEDEGEYSAEEDEDEEGEFDDDEEDERNAEKLKQSKRENAFEEEKEDDDNDDDAVKRRKVAVIEDDEEE